MDNYSLIEDKLEEANVITALLKKSFVGKKENRNAYLRVEAKIKEFLNSELEKLFGLKDEAPIKEFAPDELGALKALASRMTNKESKPVEAKEVVNPVIEAPKEEKQVVTYEVNGVSFTKEISARGQVRPANYKPPPAGHEQYQIVEQQLNSRPMAKDLTGQIQDIIFSNSPILDRE